VTFLMGIMAGGRSNFRCSCDNCAEPGHPLSGLWGFQQEFWEARRIDCERLSASTTQTLQKYKLTYYASSFFFFFNRKYKAMLPTKKGAVTGLGAKNQLDTCCGNNLFASSPQDSYTMPLTSIQCWHVHCEECWLRTLVRLFSTFLLNYRLFPLFRDT